MCTAASSHAFFGGRGGVSTQPEPEPEPELSTQPGATLGERVEVPSIATQLLIRHRLQKGGQPQV